MRRQQSNAPAHSTAIRARVNVSSEVEVELILLFVALPTCIPREPNLTSWPCYIYLKQRVPLTPLTPRALVFQSRALDLVLLVALRSRYRRDESWRVAKPGCEYCVGLFSEVRETKDPHGLDDLVGQSAGVQFLRDERRLGGGWQ